MYAIIDSVPLCPIGIFCKGNYTLNIEYRYDVDRFEGNKAVILATTSWFGGRNLFLPYVVAIIGGLEFVLGLLMTHIHRRYGNVDRCGFSKAEITTIAPSQSRRSSRYSRSSHHLQTQQHPTFRDSPRLPALQHRKDNQDDNKPIITKFKRSSATPAQAQQNANSNRPPAVVAETNQSFDTILDMDSTSTVVFKTAKASPTTNNPPAASTPEGPVSKRQTRPHPEEHQQRKSMGGRGGEQEVSLLYRTQNPTTFQRDSVFVFPDNPHRRHEQENDTSFYSIANDTYTEDDETLTTTASTAVEDVVSEAESFVSYWSNGTMMTADESSSEADEGGVGKRDGMMGGGGSVPRKRRLQ